MPKTAFDVARSFRLGQQACSLQGDGVGDSLP